MKKAVFVVILLSFFFAEISIAQNYLIVRKIGSTRKFEYFAGDSFTYQQKGEPLYFTDIITELKDSLIVLENNIINISQIKAIDVRGAESNRPRIYRAAEVTLPTMGIGLLAIDLINNSIIEGNEFSLDGGTTSTAAVMVGTGLLLRTIRRKKIDLENPKFEAYIITY